MRKLISGVIAAIMAIAGTNAHALDLDGWEVKEFAAYDSMLSFENAELGDLEFYSLDERVPYAELTKTDKYLIAGAYSADTGKTLPAWYTRTLNIVLAYYMEHGVVPNELVESELYSLEKFAGFDLPDGFFDAYRNPVTDEWPRLDAIEFSPGDMYVRLLSKQEKVFLASQFPHFKKKFFMEVPEGMSSDELPVFYYRVYGENGILLSSLYYPDAESMKTLLEAK